MPASNAALSIVIPRAILKKCMTCPAQARIDFVLTTAVPLMYLASHEWAAVAARP